MAEGLFSGSGVAPWALLAAAFAFGLACGWLIWGGKRAGGEDETLAEGAEAGPSAVPLPAASLDRLAEEIRAARALSDESEEEAAGVASGLAGDLDALDESIKRANGRLKLLQRAVKKAGDR
ncbi:MAG: hypothetical protein RIE56_08610 [Amphiplicatus sp.]